MNKKEKQPKKEGKFAARFKQFSAEFSAHKLRNLTFLFLLVLALCYRWAKTTFGHIGMEEIIFQFRMPLTGASQGTFQRLALMVALPTVLLYPVYLVFVLWPRDKSLKFAVPLGKERKFTVTLLPVTLHRAIWAVLLVGCIGNVLFRFARNFSLVEYVQSIVQQSHFIEENYVSPDDVTLTFPQEKRNLICIYVESAETTNQDIANGGYLPENYTPEMTELAKTEISFSKNELLDGAAVAPSCGWTIAGLCAETAGIPLKSPIKGRELDNDMSEYATFLPGATTLGDILLAQGYHNVFMAGSDFDFAGRTVYFTEHGNYEIFDWKTALQTGKIPSGYIENWGFEDRKLYEYAKEKLLELSAEDQPFNFSMLTADTHFPDGYICPLCVNDGGDTYGIAWRCESRQLEDFVTWLRDQSFYENTTVVIFGDHCSMEVDFYAKVQGLDYDKHSGETKRGVYNVFMNAAVQPSQEKNRKFTTMDFFPSTLAALGVKIEGNRLGLGTNLFSDVPTLSEEYGYAEEFNQLSMTSTFYSSHLLYGD